MKARSIILALMLMLVPKVASAQLDAIIDAVVDAIEPTPVYDTELTTATENLARKIERLNQVLFGGAAETSAAYRYKALYSDLLDVTTSLTDAIGASYTDYQRLKRMYDGLESAGYYDYAVDAQSAYYIYERNVSRYKRLVEEFTKIFRKTDNTNAEVREAARKAVAILKEDQLQQRDSINMIINSTMSAIELAKGAESLSFTGTDFVRQSERDYGTDVQTDKGSSTQLGTVGRMVLVIIGLLCLIYAGFIGFRLMNGDPDTEKLIGRLVLVVVLALIIILSIQSHI